MARKLRDVAAIAGIGQSEFSKNLGRSERSAAIDAIAMALRVRNSIRDWTGLLSGGGPESVRVIGVEPPQGWLFNREADITLELKGKDGITKQVQRGMAVPIPQAIMWRLAGRVPTPLGKLTDARELDLAVYRKRGT